MSSGSGERNRAWYRYAGLALWSAGAAALLLLTLWASEHSILSAEQVAARFLQQQQSSAVLKYEEFADIIGMRTAFEVVAVIGLTLFVVLRCWALFALVIVTAPLLELGPVVKNIVERPRPAALEVIAVRDFPGGYSFPSGHALQAAIIATIIVIAAEQLLTGRMRRLVQAMAIWLALTVGWERVFDGVHWPTDVIGGFLLGTLATIGVWKALGGVSQLASAVRQSSPTSDIGSP